MIDTNELKKAVAAYLETRDGGEEEEFYMTMREFAAWQLELFTEWLEQEGARSQNLGAWMESVVKLGEETAWTLAKRPDAEENAYTKLTGRTWTGTGVARDD